MKRIIKQIRNELFTCTKRLRKLIYAKDGNHKKGLALKDIVYARRVILILNQIFTDNAQGNYTPKK